MINTIGHRRSEQAIQLGKLFTPQEALNVGLVDEVVPKEEVLKVSEEALQRLVKIDGEDLTNNIINAVQCALNYLHEAIHVKYVTFKLEFVIFIIAQRGWS